MDERKIIPRLLSDLRREGLPQAAELSVFLKTGPAYRGCGLQRGNPSGAGSQAALRALRDLLDMRPVRALAGLKRAASSGRDGFWPHYLRACLFYYDAAPPSELRMRQALRSLDAALQAEGKACGYSLRSAVHFELGEAEACIADAKRALALDPRDAAASFSLMESLESVNAKRPALDEARRISKILRYDGFAVARAGRIQGILGDYASAMANLNRAIRLAPDCAVFRTWRAEVQRRLGKESGALEDLNRAIKLNAAYHLAYTWRGRLWHNRKNYRRALSDFNRALELRPDQLRAKAWRAGTYWKMGGCRRAAVEFDALYPRQPQSSWNRGAAADALARASGGDAKWKESRDPFWGDIDAVVSRRPRNAWARAFRGRCLMEAGEPKQAVADFDFALRINPALAYAYRWRGELYRRMGRRDMASADLLRAAQLEPGHPLTEKFKAELRKILV